MRSRIQAAREEILGHARGAANVGFDDDVRHDSVLGRTGLLRKDTLVEPVIEAGEFAGFFRDDQIDAFHASGEMLGIAKIPVQTKEIRGEAQNGGLQLLAGEPPNFPGKFFDGFEGQLLRWNLLDNPFDLL